MSPFSVFSVREFEFLERIRSSSGEDPVISVSWNDAVSFCNWLSRKKGLKPCYQWNGKEWTRFPEGTGYHLPSEAQWEYACRAGSATEYCFGDDASLLDAYAVYRTSTTQPVGRKLPNAWGLFDTHGNVSEWVNDWFDKDYYRRSPTEDPHGPDKGRQRVWRSGAFIYANSLDIRAAYRGPQSVQSRSAQLGFRVARIYN